MCFLLIALTFCVFVFYKAVFVNIAFVTGFIFTVAYDPILIGDEEQIIMFLVIECGIDRSSDHLADRPRRKSCKLTCVVWVCALELAYFQIDSVFLEDVAYGYVRTK